MPNGDARELSNWHSLSHLRQIEGHALYEVAPVHVVQVAIRRCFPGQKGVTQMQFNYAFENGRADKQRASGKRSWLCTAQSKR